MVDLFLNSFIAWSYMLARSLNGFFRRLIMDPLIQWFSIQWVVGLLALEFVTSRVLEFVDLMIGLVACKLARWPTILRLQ